MRKQNDLKLKIIAVLKKFPFTRDSDIDLTREIWKEYYWDLIKKNSEGKLVVFLDDLGKLLTQDNIKRLRAKIQNEEGLFLPTSWQIAKHRKIKEEEWREYIRTNESPRL